eukprot:gnl/Spiro4/14170_TR7620_c0_g1_i1.p1 gnl/Spiro4/14170_TR7620_c0_g1~~gnl/Spiro4/14170_TR7620_c0_g1_i1.p1  ORF type:complete len:331 (-),score=66.31 gnl/Spiro4/14170_TR7620_c0_g1_i1:68-1060(-)
MFPKRLLLLSFLFCVALPSAMCATCSADNVAPLLDTLFSTLGNDCTTYASLYASTGLYFHQHDGFKTASQIMATCQGYGTFCPKGQCTFQQNGAAFVAARGNKCYLLVPYLWAEKPANHKVPGNLEPHTGWEYMVLAPSSSSSRFPFSIEVFAEIETSYSVAFNWGNPADESNYDLTVQLLNRTASRGECNAPIGALLTQFFSAKSTSDDVWRQQGNAVVLAAGGACHVAVPYAAEVGGLLSTGIFVLALQPSSNTSNTLAYVTTDTFDFPLSSSTAPPCAECGSCKAWWIALGVENGLLLVLAIGVLVYLWRSREDQDAHSSDFVQLKS